MTGTDASEAPEVFPTAQDVAAFVACERCGRRFPFTSSSADRQFCEPCRGDLYRDTRNDEG